MILLVPLLLVGSNVFMTLAWYGHLKWLDHRAWYLAVLAAWGVALFEYSLQSTPRRSPRLRRGSWLRWASGWSGSGGR